jgi:hypothetical protein
MSVLARSILFGVAFVAALVAVVLGLRRRRLAETAVERGPFVTLRKAFWAAAGLLLGTTPACDDGGTPEPEASCYLPPRDFGHEISPDVEEDADVVDAEEAEDADADAAPPEDADGDIHDEGIWVECYVPFDDAGDDFGDLDAEADAEAGPDVGPDVEPDAGRDGEDSDAEPDAIDPDAVPDGAIPPDGAGEAAVPDGDPTCYFAGPKLAGDDRRERWIQRTLLRAQAVEQLLAEPGTHPAVRAVLARDLRALRARARRLRQG